MSKPSKKIEEAAKIIAAFELFDWNLLPENDPLGVRDRAAFRQIASNVLDAVENN